MSLLQRHLVGNSHRSNNRISRRNTRIDEELTFIHPDDVDLYNAWDSRAFELQVANHELLGHGSGKLFQENADGTKNFDTSKVRMRAQLSYEQTGLIRRTQVTNPLTGKPM